MVTQVIGEYFRWAPETKLDGMAWESHLLRTGEIDKNILVRASADDVQSDPPAVADQAQSTTGQHSLASTIPTLTLSRSDISTHHAARFVDVYGLDHKEESSS